MIFSITGTVKIRQPDLLVLETGGIAYEIRIPYTTYNMISEQGKDANVFTHLVHKEDRMELYGFFDRESLKIFRLLISLSGIGPRMALVLLSHLTPSDLEQTVSAKDQVRLTQIKGVGKKMAEKILFELKDKITGVAPGEGSSATGDLILALQTLGYAKHEISKVLNDPALREVSQLEDKVKTALNILNRRNG